MTTAQVAGFEWLLFLTGLACGNTGPLQRSLYLSSSPLNLSQNCVYNFPTEAILG